MNVSTSQDMPQPTTPRGVRWAKAAAAGVLGVAMAVTGLPVVAGLEAATPAAASTSCTSDAVHVVHSDADAIRRIESNTQDSFVAKLNALRQAKGLGTLAVNGAITGPSVTWSETMAAQTAPGSTEPGWLHHARDIGGDDGVSPEQDYAHLVGSVVPNWTRIAENVGVAHLRSYCTATELRDNALRTADLLHDAFVASAGHYKNMVGDFNQVGIGVHVAADRTWVTVRFAMGDLPGQSTSVAVSPEVAKYVDAVHGLFVGRTATTLEHQKWSSAVAGGNRAAVTAALAVSDEWAGVRVNDLYRTVLGRDADASGRWFWVSQIAEGMRLEAVAAEMYGSEEYFNRAGRTHRRLAAALYRDILGRSADAAGLDHWTGLLDSGRISRSAAAGNFYASIESRRDRVTTLYQEILGRGTDPAGRDYWAGNLLSMGDVVLAAQLASSDEFFKRSQV